MIFASNQGLEASNLAPISRKMLELKELVFAKWEERVRASVSNASTLPHPILINTFPTFYDNIAEALTPHYPRTSGAVTSSSVAMEHGGERARLTHYEAPAVIGEYQILRSTIIDVLREHQVPISDEAMQIIISSFDTAIRESVTAFTLVQAGCREQFLATIAHDLRSPLAAASTAADLILHVQDRDKIDMAAGRIMGNLARMDKMIQDLLDTVMFQRGERLSLHPSSFDIADLAKEVCEQAVTVYGPRFEVMVTSITGWWGREAIKRALENLISNAVKYGAPGTPIRIAARKYDGRMQLSVNNQGDPIPSDQVETVFQVFRRAKAARMGDKQGWGIGLPYVRSVAESHGGSIGVESIHMLGTTFSIDIPIDSRPFQNAPTLE